MTSAILIDLLLLAVLVVFVLLGIRRGFILTLCSLAAVLVALVGANLAADLLSPKLADALEPRLEQSIQETLEEKAAAVNTDDGQLSATQVLAVLREKGGLYQWAADGLEQVLDEQFTETTAQVAAAAAASVAQQIARGVLFLAGFFVILLAWTLFSHALDLVARLPGLNSLNRTLGGAAGFLKGVVILYLASWVLCPLTGLVPPETAEQTRLLLFLIQHSPLDFLF